MFCGFVSRLDAPRWSKVLFWLTKDWTFSFQEVACVPFRKFIISARGIWFIEEFLMYRVFICEKRFRIDKFSYVDSNGI